MCLISSPRGDAVFVVPGGALVVLAHYNLRKLIRVLRIARGERGRAGCAIYGLSRVCEKICDFLCEAGIFRAETLVFTRFFSDICSNS